MSSADRSRFIVRRTKTTSIATIVTALVASLLTVIVSADPASAASGTDPAPLLNLPSLRAPETDNGAYYPGGVYSATPAQIASLQVLESQAVQNTITDHDLASNDQDSVLTYGRDDANAELWALLVQAVDDVHAGSATQDEVNAVAWLSAMLKRQSILMAQNAALEYTKWAGLGLARFQTLMQSNPTEGQLQGFLSQQVNNYTDGANYNTAGQSKDGGYCVYQSPAPYQDQYTANIWGADMDSTCVAPCTNLFGCAPPTPSYSQFTSWGAADATNSLYSKFTSPSTLRSVALGGTLAAVASTGTVQHSLQAFSLASVFAEPAFAAALANYATVYGTISASDAVDAAVAAQGDILDAVNTALEVTEEIGAELSATGVGVILSAIIFAITTAVSVGINVITAAALPQQLAELYTGAVSSTPDPYAVTQSPANAEGLFALFVGATLPAPIGQCDNSLLNEAGAIIAQCLNPVPVAPQTAYDPQWVVTPQGGGPSKTEATLTTSDSNGATVSQYLHGNWFVDSMTAQGHTATLQTLRMHYTDWDGNGHTAWLFANESPAEFVSVTDTAVTPTFDPAHCVASGQCGTTQTIDVVAPDGTKETVGVEGGAQPPTVPPTPKCTTSGFPEDCGTLVPTTTTVINAPSTVAVGQAVTYTAYVDDGGFASDLGTVAFDLGFGAAPGCTAQPLGPPDAGDHISIVTGLVARCTITFTTPGLHYVFATYGGLALSDTAIEPSQGAAVVNVISPSPTTTTVSASPGQPAVGQPITLTATVTPTGETFAPPGGTVQFNDDEGVLCAAATLTAVPPYTATCTTSYSSIVTRHIVATYSGDGATLTSYGITEFTTTVAPTAVTITSEPATPVVGQPVTLTATVAVTSSGADAPTPTGTVSFGSTSCTDVALTATTPYTATCSGVTYPNAGPETLNASYSGDALTGLSFGSADITVDQATTTTTVTASDSSPVVGEPVTYTATVSVDAPGVAVPAGAVDFGSLASCQNVALSPTSPYRAQCVVTHAAAGAASVSATYSGDGNTHASTGTDNVTVAKAGTSLTLTQAPASSTFGQSVTVTAAVGAVAPSTAGPALTGTVTFTVDGVAVGSPVSLHAGTATSPAIKYLSPGTHLITATYSGDSHYLTSTGTGSQVVNCGQATPAARSAMNVTATTCLSGGSVSGPITVQTGGSLALVNVTVHGPVTSTGAATVYICGTSITGAVSVSGTTGPVTIGAVGSTCTSTFTGTVTISGTHGGVTFVANTVAGRFVARDNTGGLVVQSNTFIGTVTIQSNTGGTDLVTNNSVSATLACTLNNPAPTDPSGPNAVTQRASGQCAKLT